MKKTTLDQGSPARAELVLHDKHYDRELTAVWVNDSGDVENGVVLVVKGFDISGDNPVSFGLSFGDAAKLAEFLNTGQE